MKTLEFCNITFGPANIIKEWNILDLQDFYTGVDIQCDIAFNFISGTVLAIRPYENYKCIIVQYDQSTCFLYYNIVVCNVAVGDAISTGLQLGTVNKFVHFECVNKHSNFKYLPVRIGAVTYYKTDPMPYLLGNIHLNDPNSIFINDGSI